MTESRADGNTVVRCAHQASQDGTGTVRRATPDPVAALAVEQAGPATRAEWDEYVSQAPHAELYHDYRWRILIEKLFGHECLYLIARDRSGGARGVLPMVRLKSRLFGDFLVSVPYVNYGGLLADSPAAAEVLLGEAVHRARELGADHIELRHRDGAELDWPARDDKVTMLLELPESEEALWSGFKPKLRSQIRLPEKSGAAVRQGGIELLDDFYAVFARNMRDLGTPVYPKRFFKSIIDAFADQAKILVVSLDAKPVAAGLLLAHRETMEIPWASSIREANRVGVNMLLYWAALRDAVGRGFRRFDFGRSTRDSGTFNFKKQWGAKPQPLRWHYWLPEDRALPRLTPNNPKYRAAIALWRRLPVPVANMLGPHLVRNLP